VFARLMERLQLQGDMPPQGSLHAACAAKEASSCQAAASAINAIVAECMIKLPIAYVWL